MRVVTLLAVLSLALPGARSAVAADGETVLWRALGASAHDHTFSMALSGKKATRAEAIASMQSACSAANATCTLVALFNTGCRYVALGGKQTGPNVLAPIFVVGTTTEDAQRRCLDLNLRCTREPDGGCFD